MNIFLENPEFLRQYRSRTRKGRATTAQVIFLLASGVCLAINLFAFYRLGAYGSVPACFRSIFFQIMGANFVLLLGFGTHGCGDSVSSERQSNTLEFQRITGMNPYGLALGKVIGVPVIQYLLAAVGMPITMFCVVCGGVSLVGYLMSYLLLVVFGLSYCSVSTLASAFRQSKSAQRTSPIALLLLLVWVGPGLVFGAFRMPGVGFLSGNDGLWTCLLPIHSLSAIGRGALDSYQVSLFGMRLNGMLMTLILNLGLFLACLAGTARRMESDSQSLWTKPQLLAGSLAVIVLLGSVLSDALATSASPWIPVAVCTMAAHLLLALVAAVASPGQYSFRLCLRRRAERKLGRVAFLSEGTIALPLVFSLGLVYSALLAGLARFNSIGVPTGALPLALTHFLVPILLCGIIYASVAQVAKLMAPEYGMKLYSGLLFFWTILPVIGGFLIRAWTGTTLGAEGWKFVLFLSPVGACVDTLQEGDVTTSSIQFRAATLLLALAAGGAWLWLRRYRRALERKLGVSSTPWGDRSESSDLAGTGQ